MGQDIQEFMMSHMHPQSDHFRSNTVLFNFDLLQPCMTFRKLRDLDLSIECNVCLIDNDLLVLASAWPQLKGLWINSGWGWNSQYGITPGGLVRLWQTCPSLSDVDLRLDTQGYTQVPSSDALESLRVGLRLPTNVTVNVLDAAIEADSVLAVATFFCGIAACCESRLYLRFWDTISRRIIRQFPNAEEYRERWWGVLVRTYGPRVY